jgi:putative DNA primase/helicase
LDAHGADRSQIRMIRGMKNHKAFSLVNDLDRLEGLIEEMGNVKLVIVDSIDSYTSGKVDPNTDSSVRAGLLLPLKELAKRRNVTIICIKHLNKKEDLNAIYRVSGSVAYVAVARATWLIANKRGEREEGKPQIKLFKNLGFNYANPGHDLEFTIEGGRINILGKDFSSMDDAVGKKEEGGGRPRAVAELFLREILKAGKKYAKDVREEAERRQIKYDTLLKAAKDIKMVRYMEGGQWVWSMPGDSYEG